MCACVGGACHSFIHILLETPPSLATLAAAKWAWMKGSVPIWAIYWRLLGLRRPQWDNIVGTIINMIVSIFIKRRSYQFLCYSLTQLTLQTVHHFLAPRRQFIEPSNNRIYSGALAIQLGRDEHPIDSHRDTVAEVPFTWLLCYLNPQCAKSLHQTFIHMRINLRTVNCQQWYIGSSLGP